MSNGYKVYVTRDDLATLKLEIVGDLDEIGNLVGGEDSGETGGTEEVITIIEEKEYEFVKLMALQGFVASSETPTILPATEENINLFYSSDISNKTFILSINGVEKEVSFTFNEDEGMIASGNIGVLMGEEDNGDDYIISLYNPDDEYFCADVYIKSDASGTYKVGLYEVVTE